MTMNQQGTNTSDRLIDLSDMALILILIVVCATEMSAEALTDHQLRLAQAAGHSYVDELAQIEEDLLAQGIYVKEDSTIASMMHRFKKPSRKALEMAHKSALNVGATRFIRSEWVRQSFSLFSSSFIFFLHSFGLNPEDLDDDITPCPAPPKCWPTLYRSIDGSCNNLAVTNLGQSSTVYRRLLPPAYADGIQAARNSSAADGSALPSTRLISTAVFGDANAPVTPITLLTMQFGQFLNHDMELTNQFSFGKFGRCWT